MRFIETGVELTWDEFHDLTALIRRSKGASVSKNHEAKLTVENPVPATNGEKPAGWRAPDMRLDLGKVRKKKKAAKRTGRPPVTHVRENKSGRCNQHGRQLVRDPEDGLWSCPVCLADAIDDEVNELDEEGDNE